jgi:hypothetical protein
MKKLNRWLRYIVYRRAYFDAVLMYGLDSKTARFFRRITYRYATKEQYETALSYGRYLSKNGGKVLSYV